ncbi:endospore germination permease [Neobacillus niacini]|jgi:spore germination protein KB|uniref:GerAB/ArcD/ProY family transporter n=1 Tax=Neobacillus niacini TaxID=86668 RepID=UPI001C8E097E|nr:endospore germination permease [Neobacillus niacini]MBY0147915.1 endospore germination permease [Neobacillus niacini]
MKLSETQLVWVIVTTEIIAMIGLTISPAIQIAKQDAWLSMLAGGVMGIALTFLAVKLSILHPNQSLVQYSQKLLGKWLGRLIVLPYLLAWYVLPAILLRSFADFLHLILLNRTPLWLIVLLFLGVSTYLTYSSGMTGIGRYCELVGPIIVLTLIVSFLLILRNIEYHHILPFYFDSGEVNILKGSFAPAFWFAGPFVLLVIISFIQNPRRVLAKSMLGVGITVFMVASATLMVLLVFGPNIAANLRFSYFMSVRTIDILNFIQNVDVFIMFIWVFGVIAQSSLYIFIASYETANCLNVKNWRKIVWYLLPAIFIMAILIPDETAITLFDKFWTTAIYPVCGILIPLFLLILTLIKKKVSAQSF